MREHPLVRALVTFLDEQSGGRKTIPQVSSGDYMPHIVMQPPDVREPKRDGKMILDNYLGVRFVSAHPQTVPQRTYECEFTLMYHPRVDYSEVQIGATFTVREGGKVVAFGNVTERVEADE